MHRNPPFPVTVAGPCPRVPAAAGEYPLQERKGGVPVIVRWLINALALFLTALLIPGIRIDGLWAGILAALVLGVVNAVIRPVLLFLTLPFNLLTLGLLTFVINALMLLLVAAVVHGFSVDGFWTALLGSVVLSLISGILSQIVRA